MQFRKQLFRTLFFAFLLTCLLTGLIGTVRVPVSVRAASSNIVISQVYGGGGNAGATYNADYVELFNLGSSTFSFTNWSIQYASATSNSWVVTSFSGSISPGQYFLIQLGIPGTNGSPLPTPDVINSNTSPDPTISATSGKIALVNNATALSVSCPTAGIIDFIGYGTANCFEGTSAAPAPSNTTADIRMDSCTDTDNNSIDFSSGTPNPHNATSFPSIACLKVTNVTSSTSDGTYIENDPDIGIDVTFSNNVNVDISGGTPYLLLETGAIDAKAYFSNGSGSNTLTFNYVIQPNDTTLDLDYVSASSLILNGGTITGAIGDANLTLPTPSTTTCPVTTPATPCSLGANKNIRINNQNPPTVTVNQTAGQVDPAGTLPINFTVVFSEPIDTNTFTPSDITQNGTATGVVWSIGNSVDGMTFPLSATAATGTGTIAPSIAAGQVRDLFNENNTASTSTDNIVTYQNTPFTVTIADAFGQPDPTGNTPINFTVSFSQAIDPATFTVSDITTQTGTATGITWRITNADSGANRVFTLSAIAITSPGITIVNPFIAAGQVTDTAGNGNLDSNTDAVVTFNNDIAPSVTITQANGQADPTNAFPINFSVQFTEAIIASIFTPSDVIQGPGGTATGVTWSISDSGDHTNFTLSAIGATSTGTIFPYIAANRVTDLVGNNNTASSNISIANNTVVYETTRPTVTVNQAVGQADPTSALPINFTVLFSEPINVSTFTIADITQAGTATGINWVIIDSGNHIRFTLSATTLTGKGTLIPAIGINKVTDLAGNFNFASTSTDNSVTSTAILPTPTRTPTPTPTATPTLGVFISEVAWMGTSSLTTSDEWVELYNSGPTDIDLSNWTLRSVDGDIDIVFLPTDTNHVIRSHDFFVLARSGSFSDVAIDKVITDTFSNNGESLELRNGSGILIDTANANGGIWPAGTSSTYATMERHNGTALDIDANWYTFAGTPTTHDRNGGLIKGTPGYANWALSVTATPSLTPTITRTPIVIKTATPGIPPPPPLLGINEFVPRPGSDWNNDGVVNTGDEYIELINHGVVNVILSGYRLDDEANIGSNPYALPNITLQPGERIVFYGSQTGLLLGDGGDGVRLLKSNGQLVDAYNYSVVEFPDQSFCRLPDNGGLDDWNENCYPTPGLRNSLSGSILQPPTLVDNDQVLCPIADTLPQEFVLAECTPFGNNIWNRYYWDKFGWYGERLLPFANSKWEVFAE